MSRGRAEEGQALIEFALVSLILIAVTAGLLDVGLAFYQYNAVAGLARYGSRWAGVVGGTCNLTGAVSTSDFCDQNGNVTTAFWAQPGNAPIQGPGVACPSYSTTPADYYTVSNYLGNNATTIVGSIATHYDTNAANHGVITGRVNTGFNLAKLKVCIAISSSTATPQQGDSVTVSVYYPFTPVTTLLSKQTIPLTAVSRYEVQ